jgi:hypothetical protein
MPTDHKNLIPNTAVLAVLLTVADDVLAQRQENQEPEKTFVQDQQRGQLIASHLRKSHAYWVAAAIAFLIAAWQLATGAPFVEGAFGRYVRDMLWVRRLQ